jgi:Ser/Thr protein kinase RdoA (MazF antagonist)
MGFLVQFVYLMDPNLLSHACSLYNTSPDQLTPLSGGHFNAVYQFPTNLATQKAILRIGQQDCPLDQTLGMLEWVEYLSKNGAPVSPPVRSRSGNLLGQIEFGGKSYITTAFEKADGTLAENIPPAEWSAELYHSIGKAVGKFHRLSAGYRISRPERTRPHWYESNEIHEATAKLASTSDPARQKLNDLLGQIRHLPSPPADFGLIHDDLHFANFLVCVDGTVTIIDFDDCQYGWFVMDIAMALFDVLVLYNASTDAQSQRFAKTFLSNYLAGYRSEKEPPQYWLHQLPLFLKLKELCIYASLLGHPDINLPGSWVGNFMRGRAERITGDLTYVDIDFSSL